MSSATAARPADLTTRARIRDAAIVYFGAHGFRSATVRTIAAAAGVSPALVLHHFGSKDGLRTACEEHVTALVDERAADASTHLAPADLLDQIAQRPESTFWAPFVLTALREGGEFGHRMYRRLVDDLQTYVRAAVTGGVMRPAGDERARAELIVSIKLGVLMMAPYIGASGSRTEHAPPEGQLTAGAILAASERLAEPLLELFTHGMFSTPDYLDAFRAHRDHPAHLFNGAEPPAPAAAARKGGSS